MMSVAGEEEKLNERLKAAGLWEEDLSLVEKQDLCNLLVESCTYALNEEEQRRQLELNEEKKEAPSQNTDKSCLREQPQHDIQEASTANEHQEIEEIGSSEEIIVGSASQSSHCKEAVTTQKHVTNHESSDTDLFQLADDETSSGSLIPPSDPIEVSSSTTKERSDNSAVSSIQNNNKEPSQSSPRNEDAISGMSVREPSVGSYQESLDDLSDKEASQSLLGEEKKEMESEASFHCNLVLEQSKDTTAGEEELGGVHQSGKIPTSTVDTHDEKPTVSLNLPSTSSGSMAEDSSKSRRLILDLSSRMPAQHIIELHSKRIHDIRFNSPAEFTSADEETRLKIYKEILESLAKVSLALASSRRKPNVAMPWKKVIRQLPPKTTEDKTLSSSYSLRQRRGFKNRREINSDAFEEEMDELPEVEQIVKGKDSDWLPSLRSKKKRRGDVTGQHNISNSGITQVEYQSSDDEAFVCMTGKRKLQSRSYKIPVVNGSVLPRLKEDQSPTQHSVSTALPQLNIDKALWTSSGKKYGTVLQGKTVKHDSVIRVTQVNREDSSSDVDVVEVDEPTSKFPGALKSNPVFATGSKQQSLNNKIPVLSGVGLSSAQKSTSLQVNDSSVDSDKQKGSVARSLWNASSAFVRDKLRSSSPTSAGGGAEGRPPSPLDEDVTVRPAPVKLRGEKRTLIAGTPSSSPKIPCVSKSSCPTSRCSGDQSPSAAQSGLPERSEGQSQPSLENLSERHKLVLELAARRQILEESKRGGRGSKPKPASDEGPTSFQCPLCQVYFTRARIESHAAECDGVSPISTRQQRKPQQDHQKPSCSSGPARKSQQQVVHTVTTIDSEPEDQDGDRDLTSTRARLRGDKSIASTPLTAYSAAVHAKGAGGQRPIFASKVNLDAKQQLLVDSDDDGDDLVSLDGVGRSSIKSVPNNGLKRSK